MNQLPSVAVVILSWNGQKFLEQFLPSVLTTTYPNAKIYVADNASTDNTIEFLKTTYPGQVDIVALEENGGFAKGYNEALKRVEADYYVLLNQDVEVTPDWLEPMVTLMESDQSIAGCQPKIRAYHDKTSFEYAGAAGGFIDKHGFAFCRGRFFQMLEKDNGQYDDSKEIVWATGACLMIRSSLYHQAGGFDEDYFAHFEEIDLCWRLKNAGYKIYCCCDAVVYHVGGGSLPQGNPRKTYLNYRNNLMTIVKNYSGSHLIWTVFCRMFLDGISQIKVLFSGKKGEFFAIIKAHFGFYKQLPSLIKKRKIVWQQIGQYKIGPPNKSGFYNKSIIWDHFVNSKNIYSELNSEDFL